MSLSYVLANGPEDEIITTGEAAVAVDSYADPI